MSSDYRLAAADAGALPLWPVLQGAELPELPGQGAAFAHACNFSGRAGQICLLPDADGGVAGALLGLGKPEALARERFPLARGPALLPPGRWRLAALPEAISLELATLGWLLGQYRYSRYTAATDKADRPQAELVCPAGVDAARIEALAAGEVLTRDLINTPANDMGPDELEAAVRDLAQACGATVEVTAGDALIDANLPMIHAVGRASPRAPRLIDLRFPGEGPTLTLVGKGVCFDTGGLDIKSAASMSLMKKDMGGAANVLGLAQMLHALGETRKLSLRVLIPAVENAVGGAAFRPGDILRSRKGLTVEVNNTDAEGRLVLADALALAAEDRPDCLISIATLTGAARIALGPDLAPVFCDDDDAVAALTEAGRRLADPVWRLPFWTPYEAMIEPGIADLDNAPSGGMAGAVTAALFLRRFTEGAGRYAHFDVYGWQPRAAPGRAKGGFGQGTRAILGALPALLARP